MSYPPLPPGADPNRPQDTPRAFPNYGRPEQPPPPYQQPPQQQNPYQQNPCSQQQAPYGQQQNPYQPPPQPQYQAPPQPPVYPPPQAQFGYGYGYPGDSYNKTNGLATAALVTGLAGILFAITAPVAVGLGIAALVQIKRRKEGGAGQAIAGLVVGGVVTLAWAGFIALGVIVGLNSDDYQSEPPPTYSNTTYVDELAVGECFDDAGEEDEVLRRPCSVPHDGELVSNVTLPSGPYPGDRKTEDTARARCDAEFGKYIGNTVGKSELRSSYWYPDEDYWSRGDRLVVCAAYGPRNEPLTGTVKDSKR
ncbi:hypothetical protein GCM10009789_52030 [Kribbella sancticallisti]|uniref:Regulator of septum formation n=1 Tax=Kribbella sancticallisti TaxID=460087 RepID=A0ABN2E224_9ACTN